MRGDDLLGRLALCSARECAEIYGDTFVEAQREGCLQPLVGFEARACKGYTLEGTLNCLHTTNELAEVGATLFGNIHAEGDVRGGGGAGNGTSLQYSCLENPMNGGAWKAAVHEVAKSRAGQSDFTFTFHFHALEKEMATHSSVHAWRIPGTGEPGGLPSLGSHRVGRD